jgi:TusA-related sulfurtransferase
MGVPRELCVGESRRVLDEELFARGGTVVGSDRVLRVDSELDLRGEVCPSTLVKTILALETLAPGEVLQVVLDHRPAVKDVPLSVRHRGHEVLELRQVSRTDWTVTVRKGIDL